MDATTQPSPVQTVPSRWHALGGEGFYTLARWLALLLLFVVSGLLEASSLWPPLQAKDPLNLVFWAYAVFCVLATATLFARPLAALRRAAFLVDIVVITVVSFFTNGGTELFYPLYLLPLLGLALHISPRTGIVAGVLSAAAHIGVYALDRSPPNTDSTIPVVGLALRAAALVLVPWMASKLAQGREVINQASVTRAEQETERVTRDANAYRDQMRSLYEVAYTLSTTMNYQRVLDTTLLESRKLVPYSVALVLLSTGNEDELYVAAVNGLSADSPGQRLNVNNGRIAQALRSGEPCVMSDPVRDPDVQAIASLRGCRSVALFPLRAATKSYGIMAMGSEHSNAFSKEQLGMITALANYAIIGLLNAQLVNDLREERTKLLSKEEQVRHQLARDLHDGPAQSLAAITMNVEFIKRLLERDPVRVLPELDKLSGLAKRTTHDVRTMLFELRPLVLETQGLDTTLQQYFERFQGSTTKIVLEADKITATFDSKTEGTLFNIILESVNNALKHAQAKHIWVRVRQTSTALEVSIQDDGKGFDLKQVQASYEQRGSFGLLNIDERAKLVGGVSELHSAPGHGTTVRVIVPLS